MLYGLEKVRVVQMPSVCVKWFCARTGGNLCFFQSEALSLLFKGENADEISGRLDRQVQTLGHHLHKVAVFTEKL